MTMIIAKVKVNICICIEIVFLSCYPDIVFLPLNHIVCLFESLHFIINSYHQTYGSKAVSKH